MAELFTQATDAQVLIHGPEKNTGFFIHHPNQEGFDQSRVFPDNI